MVTNWPCTAGIRYVKASTNSMPTIA